MDSSGGYGVIDEGEDLSYIRARYYDAEQQRFATKDVRFGTNQNTQSINRYAYAWAIDRCSYGDISGFTATEVISAEATNASSPSNASSF